MESLVKYLSSEWGVIAQAPAIFTTVTVLIALSVWAVVQWSVGNRITDLEGRLKLRDDQIADYKQKLSGATPDEARDRIDALELRITELSPRRLSLSQRQNMLDILKGTKYVIDITRDLGTVDSQKLSRDFLQVFQQAGWETRDPQAMGLGNPPQTGYALIVRDQTNLRPVESLVKQALEAANIRFDLRSGLRIALPLPEPKPGFPSNSFPPAPDVELIIASPLD